MDGHSAIRLSRRYPDGILRTRSLGARCSAIGDLLKHNDYSPIDECSGSDGDRAETAERPPHSGASGCPLPLCSRDHRFIRSLASGFPYSISEAFWFPALIMLTAAFVLLMLPVAWKALDEDLARYRLARLQVIGGRKLFPYLGAGLALVIVMSTFALWYSIGRSR